MNQSTRPDGITQAISASRDQIANVLSELESGLRKLAAAETGIAPAKLNGHFIRMRAAESERDWCDALLDAAVLFCRRAAFFSIRKDQLWYQGSRGIPAPSSPPPVDLAAAPAFATAVSKRAVTRAGRSTHHLSQPIAELAGEPDGATVALIPLALTDRVAGVLYSEGTPNLAGLQLITNLAGCSLECRLLLEGGASGRRIRVRTISGPLPPQDAAARRFARVAVSRIVLHEFDAVRRGRVERSIYSNCAASIDAARENYREHYPGLPDYLHQEIVRTLTSDQPDLLGTNYPYPRP